jgi:hypothetical protein
MNKKAKRIIQPILIVVLCAILVCILLVTFLFGPVLAVSAIDRWFSDPLNFRDYRAEFELVKDELYRAYGETCDGERAGARIYYDKETDAYVVSVSTSETTYRVPSSKEAYDAMKLIDTKAFYSGNNMDLNRVGVNDNRVVFESSIGDLALIWSPDGKPKDFVLDHCDRTYIRSLGDDWYLAMEDKSLTLEDSLEIIKVFLFEVVF